MKVEGVQKTETISTTKPPGQIRRRIVWSLSSLAVGLLLAKLVFSLNIMWQIFNFAFQVDESEGMIVAETLLMDHGTDIYAPLNADRFIAAPYTPLYYLLNWPFLHFMGASFKPGRFLSFLAFCGIGFLIYKIVKQFSVQRPASSVVKSNPFHFAPLSFVTQSLVLSPQSFIALLAALFWGSLGLAAFWGGAVKPDILALFFSLGGVYAIFRYVTTVSERDFDYSQKPDLTPEGQGLTPSSTKRFLNWPRFGSASKNSSLILPTSSFTLYSGAVLFALAALTKQTAFAGVLACAVFLFLQHPLVAVRFGAVWAVLAFGPMLLMNWLSNGGFWYHIVTVHELPWSLENYSKFFGTFVQSYQLYVGLSLVFLVLWLVQILKAGLSPLKLWKALRSHPATLFVLYLGTAWGMGLSSGTYGGNHNHLLELAAALCLCSGLLLVQIRQWWQSRPALKWVYPAVLLLVCLQTLGLFVGEARVKPQDFPVLGSIGPAQSGLDILRNGLFDKRWPGFYNEQWLGLEYRAPLARQKEGLSQVAAFMTNDIGPYIYTDNVSLAIASGKPIMTTDPFTQTHATDLKRWDESRLIYMIEHKQFHLIVLRAPIENRLSQTGEARDIYLSPGLARAILANYKLTQPNVAFIYEPKS